MRTTVFCAVYSKDPQRFSLIFDHLKNLQQQTIPVEPIYVFEAGETPPSHFPARWFSAGQAVSIYQAWNIAIATASTDYLMNLNLDDRLHHDAIERMQIFLQEKSADLVGGDWKITYSQEETDQVAYCYPIEKVPFLASWPPAIGTQTRLGSGSGHRGTYGAATLWRRSLHRGCARYPQHFEDGTVIRSIGDALWWVIVKQKLNGALVRLPMIIGNYHSHPSEQAEFRYGNEWELANKMGIRLV